MTFKTKFYAVSNFILPTFVTIILIIIGGVNFQIYDLFVIMPFFSATCVFYWCIFDVKRMPKFFVLLLGLLQDILYGLTLGSSSLLLLVLMGIVIPQRGNLLLQPFWVCWLVFSAFIALFAFMDMVLGSLLVGKIILDPIYVYKFLITVLFYPLLHRFFRLL